MRPITTVEMPDGTAHAVRKLFAYSNSNAKLRHTSGEEYVIRSLSMLPHKIDGLGNVCKWASKECVRLCINLSGLTHGDSPVRAHILRGRLARRILWARHRDLFREMWHREADSLVRYAKRQGKKAACRPNMFSDIPYWDEEPDLITNHPDIMWYGYTKSRPQYERFLRGDLPSNVYLTYSRSEQPQSERFALDVLSRGGNVAWVFRVKYDHSRGVRHPLPKTHLGFEVIDGDISDLRFKDEPGKICGLRGKGMARRSPSAFVSNPVYEPELLEVS